jgi:hypothetical protein
MKRSTIGKIFLGAGLLLTAGSVLGIVGGIYTSFAAMKFNESAGIGAIGNGIWFAMLSGFTALVGIVFAIVGLVFVVKNKSGN